MGIYILSVLVSNHFGVLTRVTNLFSRRGYNIKGLSVGETEDPKYSRITIITEGDEQMLVQIKHQLLKLHDVKAASVLPFEESVSRELLIIKTRDSKQVRDYLAKPLCTVLDESEGCLVVEITGESEEINNFICEMRTHGILEICRTGVIALQKGLQNVLKN